MDNSKTTLHNFKAWLSTTITTSSDQLDHQFVKNMLDIHNLEESNDIFCIPCEKLLEWEVFSKKSNLKQRLLKLECKQNKDFTIVLDSSSRGRPKEIIKLTVDCFKELCVTANNEAGKKARAYYLVLERLFKQYVREEFASQLQAKNTQIHKERKLVVNAHKRLRTLDTRFTMRHKFRTSCCVYILKHPDILIERYKIGFTNNINRRLAQDRTMIPNIQVCAIFYTPHHILFEKVIKTKFASKFEYASHEWVNESLEKLIEGYRDLNNSNGFEATEETELWRYNLELDGAGEKILPEESKAEVDIAEPELVPESRLDPNSISEKTTCTETPSDLESKSVLSDPESISEKTICTETLDTAIDLLTPDVDTYNTRHAEKGLSEIFPCFTMRYDYIKMNEMAPDKQRYCNGFCQGYQPIEQFMYRSKSLLTICRCCQSMADTAKLRLDAGTITAKDIRKDPNILKIGEEQMQCRKCKVVKNKTEFRPKKRQCKKCCNATRTRFGDKFTQERLVDEVRALEALGNVYELKEKLQTYVKVELHKICSYVKVGRKFDDNKQKVIENLVSHFGEKF
jgi:phage anti-repressor protein